MKWIENISEKFEELKQKIDTSTQKIVEKKLAEYSEQQAHQFTKVSQEIVAQKEVAKHLEDEIQESIKNIRGLTSEYENTITENAQKTKKQEEDIENLKNEILSLRSEYEDFKITATKQIRNSSLISAVVAIIAMVSVVLIMK
ncbi:hypothetical protein [Sediminitomix flava]|uniref:Uncharacterized protein n=1 Tax=Sediminitomix flava TaxID=379075 RepID=A0A315ZA37_SEDFL|nr:hypothetical protein [Sediminitomix flava]PWJ42142.1 hypothetical protein BC781_103392 [Sediminitomix flava]